ARGRRHLNLGPAVVTVWPGAGGPEGYGIAAARRVQLSAGSPDLARRLSGPALERMRERAHLMKTEQPRDLGYVQPAVIEVTNSQIAPELLKYFSESSILRPKAFA